MNPKKHNERVPGAGEHSEGRYAESQSPSGFMGMMGFRVHSLKQVLGLKVKMNY